MNRKVLMVDDDERILRAYQRSIRIQFDLEVALGPEKALEIFTTQGPFAVVVADMQMPVMNGVILLGRIKELDPETSRIMLTGNADQLTAMDAVNHGQILRFLTKPCSVPDLTRALEAGLEQYRLVVAERELLEHTLSGAVDLLTDLLTMADPRGLHRAQEVAEYAMTVGRMVNAPDPWSLRLGGLLAQVGRLTIPRDLLEKEARGEALSPAEQDVMRRVPEVGAKLLTRIPRLEEVARIIHYQGKTFDGGGFPEDAVAREDIPLGARVLACVQAYVGLEQRLGGPAAAIQALLAERGRFDPRVFKALLELATPGIEGLAALPEPVLLADLVPGMTLAQDLRTQTGVLLFTEGSKLRATHIEKILNFARLAGIPEPIQAIRPTED